MSISSDQALLSVQGAPVAPPMIPDDFFSDPGTYTKDAPASTSAPSPAAQPVVQSMPSGSLPKEKSYASDLPSVKRSAYSTAWLQSNFLVCVAIMYAGISCCEDHAGTGAGGSEQQQSLEEGIRSMEAGSWDRASASFSDALHNSQGDAKNLAAQYLAAVMLCKVHAAKTLRHRILSCFLCSGHVMSGVLLGLCKRCS